MQSRTRDRSPAKPRHRRVYLRCTGNIAKRQIDVQRELAAHTDGQTFLHHDDVLAPDQHLAQLLDRERAKRYQRDETNTKPVRAHLVDRVLNGAIDRTHGDDQHFGVISLIGAQQAAGVAAELRLKFCRPIR